MGLPSQPRGRGIRSVNKGRSQRQSRLYPIRRRALQKRPIHALRKLLGPNTTASNRLSRSSIGGSTAYFQSDTERSAHGLGVSVAIGAGRPKSVISESGKRLLIARRVGVYMTASPTQLGRNISKLFGSSIINLSFRYHGEWKTKRYSHSLAPSRTNWHDRAYLLKSFFSPLDPIRIMWDTSLARTCRVGVRCLLPNESTEGAINGRAKRQGPDTPPYCRRRRIRRQEPRRGGPSQTKQYL